jgi:hypothetical protein
MTLLLAAALTAALNPIFLPSNAIVDGVNCDQWTQAGQQWETPHATVEAYTNKPKVYDMDGFVTRGSAPDLWQTARISMRPGIRRGGGQRLRGRDNQPLYGAAAVIELLLIVGWTCAGVGALCFLSVLFRP